jgi:hypothetical protein
MRPPHLETGPQEVFHWADDFFLGIGWAFALAPLYGLVVFAGWFFDVIVYTVWLKRRMLEHLVGVIPGRCRPFGRALEWARLAGRDPAGALHPVLDPHAYADILHKIPQGL